MSIRRSTTLALLLSTSPTLAAADAHASSVELFVQTPYDFATGHLDLDRLETANSEPVFRQALTIPYDRIEAAAKEEMAKHTKGPFEGTAECPTALCPDAHWHVDIKTDVRFTKRAEPVLQSFGSATDNGVRVTLDAQVEVKVDAHGEIKTSLEDVPFDVSIVALIGLHGEVNLNLYPVLRAEGLRLNATLDYSNVDIEGGDGEAIKWGTIVGSGLGGFTPLGKLVGGPLGGGVLGAITGAVSVERARDYARDAISEAARRAVAAAGAKATEKVNAALQPQIAEANDILREIVSHPLPGLDRTMGEMPVGLEVRSVTHGNQLRTVVTARFRNDAGAGYVSGKLHLPKTACRYVEMDSRLTGHVRVPVEIVPINEDLLGAPCGSLQSDIEHQVWYGQSPERALASGDAANALTEWAPLGSVFVTGTVVDSGNAYTCDYRVQDLPDASFFSLAPREGSSFAQRLEGQLKKSRKRYLVASGAGLVLDPTGAVLSPTSVDLGAAGPKTLADCDSGSSGGGTGLTASEKNRLLDALNPNKCPQCNVRLHPTERYTYLLENVAAFRRFASESVARQGR